MKGALVLQAGLFHFPFAGFESSGQQIDLWIKIVYSLFVCILIPIYWKHWGPANFLWFSDIALIVNVPALWLENSLLASMMAVGVLLPEIYWNFELLMRILTGKKFTDLTGYMFDEKRPLFLRLLSLFHVILPPVLILMLIELGYNEKAIFWQTGFAGLILWLCYRYTPSSENINWAFGFGRLRKQQSSLVPFVMLCFYLLAIYLPTHFFLSRIL